MPQAFRQRVSPSWKVISLKDDKSSNAGGTVRSGQLNGRTRGRKSAGGGDDRQHYVARSIAVHLNSRFGAGPGEAIESARERMLSGFVQRQAPQLQLKRAKLLTTALRSFCSTTRYRGQSIGWPLSSRAAANWSMPSIPRGLRPIEVRRRSSQIDRRTAVGRRDDAILLLLARLGLRSGEVAFLELEDIDWRKPGCFERTRARAVVGPNFHLPGRSAKRSWPICAMEDRTTSRRVLLRAPTLVRGF